jgi:tetratricopeptide (TPR) repeat protein
MFAGSSGVLLAQQVRVSEREVELETRFIDANRERILGNYDKAIPIYEEILKRDEDNHAAAYELARVYDAMETYDKAIRYAKQAIEGDPANNWYQQFLADVYQKVGRNEEAAEIYEELVKRMPDNEDFYFKWAYYLVRANEIDQAVKVYDRLESQIGFSEELIRRKHSLYLGIGDTRKAGKELERLTEAFPGNPEYQHLLAAFYEEVGEQKKAEEVYRHILEIDPNNAKARLALAGKPEKASDEIQYLHSLRPIFEKEEVDLDLKIKQLMPVIQKVAATGDQRLGETALELTGILERLHSDEAKVYAASGDLLYHLGRRSEAIGKYEKTLQLDDTVFLVWEQLLYALYEEGNYETLRERAEEAMDFFPNQAVAYYLYGVASSELGEQEDARSALEQALLMAGSDPRMTFQVQARLGEVYADLEAYDKSARAFDAALALNEESAEVLIRYSYTLALQGSELEKARQMAEQANNLHPGQPSFQDTFGWVFYKMKNYNKAKKWIGEALKNGGDEDPDILEHYGDVLFQLEETDEALRYWNKARQKGSDSKLLEKKINDKQLYE